MRVIAVIPNYNMRESLAEMLPDLLADRFDRIYVLDDASQDGSADYIKARFPDIILVPGDKNIGAGANRNRILPYVSGDELILFLDADLELRSRRLAAAVEHWFADPSAGMVGGLILARSGRPMLWNYGTTMSPAHDYRAEVYEQIARRAQPGSPAFNLIRQMALEKGDTYNYEIMCAPHIARKVEWVAEGLFAIRGDLFRAIGGYDERFRYHADQDLGIRVIEAGYEVHFKPGITARHLEIDVRGGGRSAEFREGKFLFYQKHWGMSREVFERLMP